MRPDAPLWRNLERLELSRRVWIYTLISLLVFAVAVLTVVIIAVVV
jgi:hypothetical protein